MAQGYQTQLDPVKNPSNLEYPQLSYDELQDRVYQFIQWDRPSTDHWPTWHDYDQATYDPNRWEAMDRYWFQPFSPITC